MNALEVLELSVPRQRWHNVVKLSLAATALLFIAALIFKNPLLWKALGTAGGIYIIARIKLSRANKKFMNALRNYEPNLPPEPPEEPPPPPPIGQLINPIPAGPPRQEPVSTTVDLTEQVSFETAEGEPIVLGPGTVDVAFRLSYHKKATKDVTAEQDYPLLETWVTSADGTRWHARTFLQLDVLTLPLTPDGLPEHEGKAIFWVDAPQSWQDTLQNQCLLAEARDLIDTRERFNLPVGDTTITIMLKYQGPSIDVAWLEEEGKLLIRASNMYYEIREDRKFKEIADQISFGYRLDPSTILPFTTPQANWSSWEGWIGNYEPPAPKFERA